MPKKKQVVVTEKERKVAKAISLGVPIKRALLDAGYAPGTANKGKAGLTVGVKAALDEELKKAGSRLSTVANEYQTEERVEQLIAGKLIDNTLRGRDESTASLKLLGQMRRAGSAMRSEIGGGIIVIKMPDSLANAPDPYTLASEERMDFGRPSLLGGNENYQLNSNGQFEWKGERYQAGNPNTKPALPSPSNEDILRENGTDEESKRRAKFGAWTGTKRTAYDVPLTGVFAEAKRKG